MKPPNSLAMFLRYSTILSLCLLATDATAKKESQSLLRRNLNSPKKVECTPYEVDGAAEGNDKPAELSKWVCESNEEDEPSGTPLVYDIEGLGQSFFKDQGIKSGQDSITINLAKKSHGHGNKPYTITVLPGSGVAVNPGKGHGNGHGSGKGNGRQLAPKTGARKVLVVRVSTPNSAENPERSAADLSNDCFGVGGIFADTVQLVSQFNACSGGKFQPGPAANNATTGIMNGVVDVMINFTATNVLSNNIVENAARNAATVKVGALTQWDHVVFTWTQYANWTGAVAYAYVGGSVSCFRDTRVWQMGVQVHELGRKFFIYQVFLGNGGSFVFHFTHIVLALISL